MLFYFLALFILTKNDCSLFYRVAGSVIGSVLGIIIWEICRGNPYGLTVLCFFVYIPAYHIFLFITQYRVVALMSQVTLTLVIVYEYNYVVENVPNHDEVYTVAGKVNKKEYILESIFNTFSSVFF